MNVLPRWITVLLVMGVSTSVYLANANQPAMAQTPPMAPPALYVLVSFSMPATLLAQYCQDAQRFDATLVLRGLKDNRLNATTQALRAPNLQSCRWQIEPRLFSVFHVDAVPCVMLLVEPPALGSSTDSAVLAQPAHVAVAGNVSIASALHAMQQQDVPDNLKDAVMHWGVQ